MIQVLTALAGAGLSYWGEYQRKKEEQDLIAKQKKALIESKIDAKEQHTLESQLNRTYNTTDLNAMNANASMLKGVLNNDTVIALTNAKLLGQRASAQNELHNKIFETNSNADMQIGSLPSASPINIGNILGGGFAGYGIGETLAKEGFDFTLKDIIGGGEKGGTITNTIQNNLGNTLPTTNLIPNNLGLGNLQAPPIFGGLSALEEAKRLSEIPLPSAFNAMGQINGSNPFLLGGLNALSSGYYNGYEKKKNSAISNPTSTSSIPNIPNTSGVSANTAVAENVGTPANGTLPSSTATNPEVTKKVTPKSNPVAEEKVTPTNPEVTKKVIPTNTNNPQGQKSNEWVKQWLGGEKIDALIERNKKVVEEKYTPTNRTQEVTSTPPPRGGKEAFMSTDSTSPSKPTNKTQESNKQHIKWTIGKDPERPPKEDNWLTPPSRREKQIDEGKIDVSKEGTTNDSAVQQPNKIEAIIKDLKSLSKKEEKEIMDKIKRDLILLNPYIKYSHKVQKVTSTKKAQEVVHTNKTQAIPTKKEVIIGRTPREKEVINQIEKEIMDKIRRDLILSNNPYIKYSHQWFKKQ